VNYEEEEDAGGDTPLGPYLSGEGTRGTAQGQLGINMFAQAVPNAEPAKAEEVVVCFGVIDILQDYSTRKVLERRVKSLTHDPSAISVAPPKLYAKRFLDFITSHLFLAPPGYRTSDTTGGATAGIPTATGTLTTVATASSSVAPTAAVTRQGSTGSTIGSEVVPFPGFGRVSAGAREAGAGVGGGIGEAGGVDVEKVPAGAVAPLPAVAAIAASERFLVSGAASNGSSGNSPTAEGVPLAVVMSPSVNMKGLSAMGASAPAGEEVVGAQTQT